MPRSSHVGLATAEGHRISLCCPAPCGQTSAAHTGARQAPVGHRAHDAQGRRSGADAGDGSPPHGQGIVRRHLPSSSGARPQSFARRVPLCGVCRGGHVARSGPQRHADLHEVCWRCAVQLRLAQRGGRRQCSSRAFQRHATWRSRHATWRQPLWVGGDDMTLLLFCLPSGVGFTLTHRLCGTLLCAGRLLASPTGGVLRRRRSHTRCLSASFEGC